MSFALIAGGVTVAGAGYKIYDTAHKNSVANQMAKTNKRPVYNPDGTVKYVYDMAAANLSDTGLQDYGQRQIEQRQSDAIDAVLKSGGKADFNVIHSTYGNDIQSLLANIEREKAQRIAAFNNAAYNKQQQQDTTFQVNQLDPYKDQKQAEALLRQQAEQSKNEAISTVSSAVGNYGITTSQPGQYGIQTPGQQNRAINSALDNTIAANAANPVSGANPAVAPASDYRQPAGTINTNFDYTNFRPLIGYNTDGTPIYG